MRIRNSSICIPLKIFKQESYVDEFTHKDKFRNVLVKEVFTARYKQRYRDKKETLGTAMENTMSLIIHKDYDLLDIDSSYYVELENITYKVIDVLFDDNGKHITLIVKEGESSGYGN